MKKKKVPMRMCVACHTSKPKKELIRVVRLPEKDIDENGQGNRVVIDLRGKISGRGAYICYDVECFKKAKKGRKLDKALDMVIGDNIYDELIRQMEAVEDRQE